MQEKTLRDIKASNHNQWLLYIVLALLTFVFLAVFSYYTSPFTPVDNGADAAFFRMVGRGMTQGYLPYRDFFDMKGPYFFLLEYIGQLISSSRWGIFLLQWVNLFSSLLIICAICEDQGVTSFFLKLLLTVSILYIASFTFEGGNLTEEFSLAVLFLCLLFGLRYLRYCEQDSHTLHNPLYGGVYGFTFGILAFVRITNAALVCAIVFVISLNLVMTRQYKNLLWNAIAFVIGFLLAVLPMGIYYQAKGELSTMLEAVFILGGRYSSEKTIFQHILQLLLSKKSWLLLCLIVIPCIVVFATDWATWRERLLMLVGSIATLLCIAMGNNYTHYYTLAIPLVFLGELSTAAPLKDGRNSNKGVIAAIFLIAMFCVQFIIAKQYFVSAKDHLLHQERYQMGQRAAEIEARIPEEEKGSVFSYNISPGWYSYTKLLPCNRYCGWQNHYINLIPRIETELEVFFRETPPEWVVIPINNGRMPSFLEIDLATNYHLDYENDTYALLNHN